MKKGQWIELFKAGDYGEKGTYTESDLSTMAKNYNADDEIPIVAGHPKVNHPRWGGIDKVAAAGGVLLGRVGSLHEKMSAAIQEGKFNNRSVRIGETPDGPKVMHLGMLGAALPEVSGLGPISEFSDDIKFHDFTEAIKESSEGKNHDDGTEKNNRNQKEGATMTEKEIAALKKEVKDNKARAEAAEAKNADLEQKNKTDMAAAARKGYEAKVKDFPNVIPKDKRAAVIEFCMVQHAEGEVKDFSYDDGDGGKKSVEPAKFFFDFVKGMEEKIKDLKKGKPHLSRIGTDFSASSDDKPVVRGDMAAKL